MLQELRIEDPFKHLQEDHKKVSAILKKLEKTSPDAVDEREDLAFELTELLTRHSELEKTVLYPLLEKIPETHELTLESYEEHKLVERLLGELGAEEPDSETWAAKLAVLKENIEAHVKEEEHDLFKQARKALDEDRQARLAREMARFLARTEETVSV